MSLLNNIKSSISDSTINNLANYLDEDFNGTTLGLDLNLIAFLASIIKFVGSEKSAKSLLSILSDGGHTGDIFNNIESFSKNTEKSKLLETIGSNISNHFLNDNTSIISDKVSDMAGIKKSSSQALQSFAAPLVLGFLGKEVREKNMNATDLKKMLSLETEEVSTSLPMSISVLLNLPKFNKTKSFHNKHHTAVNELNKDEDRKKSNWGLIWPWILLFAVGGIIYYFANLNSEEKILSKTEISSVSDTLHPEEFLPLDTLKPNIAKLDSTSKASQPFIHPADPVHDKKQGPLTKKVEQQKKQTDKPLERKQQTNTKKVDTTQAGHSAIPSGAFGKNSAEVISVSSIQSIINQLKDRNKKITLTPLKGAGRLGEDRAFAIRDILLEQAIPLSQIAIGGSKNGNNASGLSYKITE